MSGGIVRARDDSCNNATLRYRVDALGIEIDRAPRRPGIIVPELTHSVQPIGAVAILRRVSSRI